MKRHYPPFDPEALRRVEAHDWNSNAPDPCPWGCRQGKHPWRGSVTRGDGVAVMLFLCPSCDRPWTEQWEVSGPVGRTHRLLGINPGHPKWAVELLIVARPWRN